VWFDDGANGFQMLTPDAPLASIAFAFNADRLDGFDADAFTLDGEVESLVSAAGYVTMTLADSRYAASSHAHAGEDITDGTVAEARIDPVLARDAEVPDLVASAGYLTRTLADARYAVIAHAHDGSDITAGTVAEARIDAALARDAEIIVIGSPRQRLTSSQVAVFGKTVDYVLKHAPCRVLVTASVAS